VLAGVVAGGTAVGVGHGAAAVGNPAASPLVAVGSVLVDAAPTPVKEVVVQTFGTYDKPLLLIGVGAVLLGVSGLLGALAWRRRGLAVAGVLLLGAVGAVAAWLRGGPVAVVPSVLAGGLGAVVLSGLPRLTDEDRTVPGRRRFLVGLGAAAALAAVGGVGGALLDHSRRLASAARRVVGLPAPASPALPVPTAAHVPGMTPFLTPTDDFYRVDISLVTPRIDPDEWRLTLDGMVDRPQTLTYQDLLSLPMIERTITMTCVSNEVGGPYLGTATWLGVPFADIIERVGVRAGVDQAFSYSFDSGYTCSTPYAALTDGRDAMVAVGMNGRPLPDAHGFPARMIVPGLYGFVSATKWLQRIEFTTYARRSAYWTDRGWATDAPILTQSRIDVPTSLGTLPRDKPVIAGIAWAQHRGIRRVEVRIDRGDWEDATLAADAGVDLWRQWSYRYDGPPGAHSLEVRATDGTGHTQPERRTRVFPSGARGWHQIRFTAE
jgi:DMSO/TMAO reductase YedYZ molybdopterin-dependent catalytic subunit